MQKEQLKEKYVRLMMCVNNPDNGRLTDRCVKIDYSNPKDASDFIFELDSVWENGVFFKVDYDKSFLKFGRLKIPYARSQDWVGNWCWNQYVIKVKHLLRILNYCKKSKKWSLDSATERFWNAWKSLEDIKIDDLILKHKPEVKKIPEVKSLNSSHH